MGAYPRTVRGTLWLAAAGWAAVSFSGCAQSSIDAQRRSFVHPPAIATRAADRAELSLTHNQTLHELNLEAGTAPRPAASLGTFHEAYQRWIKGEVRKLPAPSQAVSGAGQ